jgi:hypothetical protein
MAWLLTVVELEAHARFESFRGSSTWLTTVSASERDISQSVYPQVGAFPSVDRQLF